MKNDGNTLRVPPSFGTVTWKFWLLSAGSVVLITELWLGSITMGATKSVTWMMKNCVKTKEIKPTQWLRNWKTVK